ncbi:cyclic nucleotide-gated channel alpha-4-like isoform X1 [Lampetra planeri]
MDEASSKAAGRRPFALDPTGDLYNRWQVVSCAFTLFNWFSIICRVSFMDVQVQFLPVWLTLDYVSDAVNLVDMVFLSRTGFMECGLLVTDVDRMRQHYVRSSRFRLDALALVPTDLLYAYTGVHYPVVRLNRLLRFPRIFDCFDQVETHTNYPKTFRIIKLVVYIYLMVHWNACFYYLLSAYIGFGQDGWVYPAHETPGFGGTGRQYMFCIYFSTLILLTIGNIPKAEREAEFLFVVVDFLITIFVFATILGNVASICASVNEAGDKFLAEFNEVKDFVRFRAIGKDMDRKVVEWYEYLHLSNKSLGEEDVLKELPVTLRAAIAINVHMQTLQKVEIFKNCELGLLEELVLKLRPKLYSPGDYVCRKGDIGREMYFIKEGKLAVVADDGVTQYAVLGDGSYFGEISILKIPARPVTGARPTSAASATRTSSACPRRTCRRCCESSRRRATCWRRRGSRSWPRWASWTPRWREHAPSHNSWSARWKRWMGRCVPCRLRLRACWPSTSPATRRYARVYAAWSACSPQQQQPVMTTTMRRPRGAATREVQPHLSLLSSLSSPSLSHGLRYHLLGRPSAPSPCQGCQWRKGVRGGHAWPVVQSLATEILSPALI